MFAFALAQMRRNLGRLMAAGIAILIGTAFVAATLLASSLIERASADALTAGFAQADLVLTGDLSIADITPIDAVEGVVASHAATSTFVEFSGNGRTIPLLVTPTATAPELRAANLVTGTLPAAGELLLPADTADDLGAAIGEDVALVRHIWRPATAPSDAAGATDTTDTTGATDEVVDVLDDGQWIERSEQLRLVGLFEDPGGVFNMTGGAALIEAEQAYAWEAEAYATDDPSGVGINGVSVLLDPAADVEEVRADLADATGEMVQVRTRHEAAQDATEELTGASNTLTALGLAAAAIALIVAGLVISNTFQVLVAQRTRSLALLRCIGATTRQVKRSVTIEALLVGVGSSLAGIAVGGALVQIALSILRQTAGGAGLPTTITLTPAVVLVPVIAGTVVAWFAAIAPARAAGRVAPLAAMRPSEGPTAGARAGRIRLAFVLLLSLSGAALLGLGMLASARTDDIMLGLAVGILGGLLSFVGVLVGAVFWIPRAIGVAALLVTRRSRPATRLAVANSLRNPRRTAATSSALLIGVTLVAMMSTGASTAQAGFEQELDRAYPVDITVASFHAVGDTAVSNQGLPWAAEVAELDQVAATTALGATPLQLEHADRDNELFTVESLIGDPDEVNNVVRDTKAFAPLDGEVVLMPRYLVDASEFEAGDQVTVTALDATWTDPVGASITLTVQYADLEGTALVSAATADRLGVDPAPSTLWVRAHADADPSRLAGDIQQLVQDYSVGVFSAAAEREGFEQIISTLLLIVVGLLAVAVVIALVGVANTLSLSVIERRRESATLRAIGLTRAQLRQTLAIESLFIAGAGALLGVILGTIYGYIGTRTLLGSMTENVPLAVPWVHIGLIIAVSLVAGVVASLVPGRRAARTSPVAALATE